MEYMKADSQDVATAEDEWNRFLLDRSGQVPMKLLLERLDELRHDAQGLELACSALEEEYINL